MTQNTAVPDLTGIHRSLGAIEGKQDVILLRIAQETEQRKALESDVEKLAARVTSVETKITYWGGALGVIASVAFLMKEKILVILGVHS